MSEPLEYVSIEYNKNVHQIKSKQILADVKTKLVADHKRNTTHSSTSTEQ